MMNDETNKKFPSKIYADDDLVCGDHPDDHCRVRYVRADLADAVLGALVELNNRVHTNYDFNADPDKITMLVGNALTGIKHEIFMSSHELTRYLDSIDIHSDNIGDIRRACFVPWDSPWNSLVRDETAARERTPKPPEGMKLNAVRMMDGKPINCFIEQ